MTVNLSFKNGTSLNIYRAVSVDIRDWRGVKAYFISYVPHNVKLLKCFPFSSVIYCEIKAGD